MTAAGLQNAELSVLFVGDTAMRSLNRRYRRKDTTTDVLSFPFREGPYGDVQQKVLGDIVISVPTARRQAEENGISVSRELDQLLVHGLLHLLGYDHERGDTKARQMYQQERRLLAALDR
jgi:probable rRNA maturation factor